MEEKLKSFLEKFAELERRVRKLAAEDRGLREELRRMRVKLEAAETEVTVLREMLKGERVTRSQARDQLDRLIAQLESWGRGGKPREAGGVEARGNECGA